MAEKEELVKRRQARGDAGEPQPQMGERRKDGWTAEDEAAFLIALAESCNVSEAAREIGRSRTGAYHRKKTDPRFARAWEEALEMGYAEIELMLMRAVLFGSETEEVVIDGEGAVKTRKVKRHANPAVALRLLTFHRDRMERRRAERAAQAGPGGPAAIAQVDDLLDRISRERAAEGS